MPSNPNRPAPAQRETPKAYRGCARIRTASLAITATAAIWLAGCVMSPPAPEGPIADAGRTARQVDAGTSGSAVVALDATASSHPTGQILSYQWTQADDVVAEGETAVINLAPGQHDLVLVVTDVDGRVSRDNVRITVIGPPRTEFFLTIDITGRGTVEPAQGTTIWPANGLVELRAVPQPGAQFVRWSGDVASEVSSTTLLLDRDKWVTAEFQAILPGEGQTPRFFLPLPAGQHRVVSQGNNGNLSHPGRFAWDFPMPIGTPVVASGAGRVVFLREDSPRNDPDSSIRIHPANVVRVDHGGGLISQYAHLDFGGVIVQEGQYVVRGQVLGFSCDTGQSTGPHLHYEIVDAVGTSVPSGFWEDGAAGVVPDEGDTVTSRNELSIESRFGYSPSTIPKDAFAVNRVELLGPTPPVHFLWTNAEYLITGRVLDDADYVCAALVDPVTFETSYCELTEVNPDGTFVVAMQLTPDFVGRHYFGVISGKGGAEGVAPLSIVVENPPSARSAPVALVEQPDDPAIDFLGTGTLRGRVDDAAANRPISYQWVQVSGPPAIIHEPTAAETLFTLEYGDGISRVAFQLTVFDGEKHSMPSQVEYAMTDVFSVKGMGVVDFVCDSPAQCPVEAEAVLDVSKGVISGWVEVVNAREGDVLTFTVVDPQAKVVVTADVTIQEDPGLLSFWRFAWATEGLPEISGAWTGHFYHNGEYEGSAPFRFVDGPR
jgi:murein DD-endopeptidase MepM/ murein hydrolase activator NlpD